MSDSLRSAELDALERRLTARRTVLSRHTGSIYRSMPHGTNVMELLALLEIEERAVSSERLKNRMRTAALPA